MTLPNSNQGIGEWMYVGLRKDHVKAYESLRGFYADLDALPEEVGSAIISSRLLG